MISLKRVDSDSDFRNLIFELDKDLDSRYGTFQTEYNNYNQVESVDTALVTYFNGRPVGCGCFKQFDDKTIELKRMFVKPEMRGNGVSKLILLELELWGKELGYTQAVLETGKNQPKAIGLYSNCVYVKIPNYNQYSDMPNSVCMMRIF